MSPAAHRSASMRWALAGIVGLGAALRIRAARQDLFGDELATYWVVTTRSFTGVVRTVATNAEITPPVTFLLSWLATRVGESVEMLRLPSLLAGVATILLVHAVALRALGRRGALVAAALTALSPFMVFYSSEARAYAVMMALVVLSTLALLRAVDTGGAGWWALHALCVALAAYTHYTCIFVLVAQFGWVLLAHAPARSRLVLATGAAAAAFLPWLPSVRGDLDSPTTAIMGRLSPFDLESVPLVLGRWSVGFPYGGPGRGLVDLLGPVGVALLLVGLGLGVVGALQTAPPLRNAWTGRARPLGLVVLLAVATPLGSMLQSTLGTNVFGVRNLAASWPYLAIAVAALLTAGRPALQGLAAGLVVAALALGAVAVQRPEYERPSFARVVELADAHPGSVVLNANILSPGPLTNLEIEGTRPSARVFRVFKAPQMERPFTVFEPRPAPSEVFRQAAVAADGAPIIVLTEIPVPPDVEALLAGLPPGYERTSREVIRGLYDIGVLVYEVDPAP